MNLATKIESFGQCYELLAAFSSGGSAAVWESMELMDDEEADSPKQVAAWFGGAIEVDVVGTLPEEYEAHVLRLRDKSFIAVLFVLGYDVPNAEVTGVGVDAETAVRAAIERIKAEDKA